MQCSVNVIYSIRTVVLSRVICLITTGDSGVIKIINMASGFMAIFTKLEKYDGTEDLTSWFKKFERCCTLANKDEDNVKGQLVMLCLSGQALAVAEQLDAETDGDLLLTAVRQRLETVFNTAAIREQKMVLFENRTQKLNESEDEFMLSLTTLYRGANPTATVADVNKSVKRKFMQGISTELRRAIYVFINDPFAVTVSHQRLLESARNAKLSLLGNEEANPAVNTVTPTPAPATTTPPTATTAPSNTDVMSAINALTQSIGNVVQVVNAIGRGNANGNSNRRNRGQNRAQRRPRISHPPSRSSAASSTSS